VCPNCGPEAGRPLQLPDRRAGCPRPERTLPAGAGLDEAKRALAKLRPEQRPRPAPSFSTLLTVGELAATTRRMGLALTYADELHKTQTRKGTDIPFLSHLLGVASLVLEEGGSEDDAIGALLHDAAEDQGGEETLAEIRQRFGPAVAEIVRACSDTLVGDRDRKPPWRERKEAYLAHLGATKNSSALRVSLADKLHNARSILRDLRDPAVGSSVFERFSAIPSETLWYYRALADTFVRLQPEWPMANELARTVDEIERTVADGD
jgi:hypothetical protein